MKKLLLGITLSLASLTAGADPVFTPYGKVTKVHFWEYHEGVLIAHQDMAISHGCPRADYFILRQANPLFKEMYAQLLSAQMTDRPVSVGVAGCHQGFAVIVVSFS